MTLDRRTFLQGLGAGAAGVLMGGPTARAALASQPAVPPLADFAAVSPEVFWRSVRAQFPLLDDPVYLNCGGLGPASQRVLDAVFSTMLKLQEHSETGHALIQPAREIVAPFVGAEPRELCFARNATEGNALIAAGLRLRDGDEVIFESHAHPGGSFPWFNQTKERGVRVKLFEPSPDSAEENLARIRALVTPRTKVIQVSHITCTDGLVMPVRAIAEFAASRGIWCHIDGAQAVGMIPVNLAALGCDSYAFCGHKWLGGPLESGAVFIRHSRLEAVAVTGIGAHSGELPFLPGEFQYVDGAARHEYGTRNAGLILGLAEAVRFQQQIGVERIAAYGRELATFLHVELSKISGVTVLTSARPELRASMVTIAHPRASAGDFFTYLVKTHRLRCRPVTEQKLNAVRISTHVFNSAAECERVVAGVRAAMRDL